jgi:hypothetical protein
MGAQNMNTVSFHIKAPLRIRLTVLLVMTEFFFVSDPSGVPPTCAGYLTRPQGFRDDPGWYAPTGSQFLSWGVSGGSKQKKKTQSGHLHTRRKTQTGQQQQIVGGP